MGEGEGVIARGIETYSAPTKYRRDTYVIPTLDFTLFSWLLTHHATPHIDPLSRSVGEPTISEIISEVVKIRPNAGPFL